MTASALFDLFTQHNAVWLIAASVFSLLVGSFLNVLILRLPKAMQAEWEQECQALSAALQTRARAFSARFGSYCLASVTLPKLPYSIKSLA